MATKNGNVITKKNAHNLEEAITLFSSLKKLPRDKFLDIFIVEQVK